MGQTVRQRYTFDQYVAMELSSSIKHEFLEGAVWAMAGGTPEHAGITVNVATLLQNQLREAPCRVFSSDLRIRVKETGLGTYPDVTVVCDDVQLDPDDRTSTTVVNPRVVVEVLSPFTEDYDQGEKLDHYRQVPSLQEIVLVAHDARRIVVWRREGGEWVEDVTTGGGEARLASLDVELPLVEVYRDPLAGG